MNPYIDNVHAVYSNSPSDVALNLWKSRLEIPVGDMIGVTFGYSIEVHRLSESEFILVVSNLSHIEITKITMAIREHSGV